MIKEFRKKLTSNSGASVVVALVLFLVCAIVGSVMLTSATAAGGNFATLPEMDRKYYMLSSSADYLSEYLSENEVIIERKMYATNPISYDTFINGRSYRGEAAPFMAELALRMLYGDSISGLSENFYTSASSFNADFGQTEDFSDETVAISIDIDSQSVHEKVEAEVKMKGNGNLEIILDNITDSDNLGNFKLVVYAHFVCEETFTDAPEQIGDEYIGTQTRRAVVSWVVDSVKRKGIS